MSMQNGSGPKKPNVEPLPRIEPTPGDLDTDEDWADLRRERRISADAESELDRLLPDTDADEWLEEETNAGQGVRPRRRPVTLAGDEPPPAFPPTDGISKLGRTARDIGDAATAVADAAEKTAGLFHGNGWRFAALVACGIFALLFFAIWKLADQVPTIIQYGRPVPAESAK